MSPPLLPTAEREATNRVVRLGFYYKSLRSFVDDYRYAGTFAPPDEGDFAGLPYTVRDRVLGTVRLIFSICSCAPSKKFRASTSLGLIHPCPTLCTQAPGGLHQGSLYIQALCIGIDDVLSRYEAGTWT